MLLAAEVGDAAGIPSKRNSAEDATAYLIAGIRAVLRAILEVSARFSVLFEAEVERYGAGLRFLRCIRRQRIEFPSGEGIHGGLLQRGVAL